MYAAVYNLGTIQNNCNFPKESVVYVCYVCHFDDFEDWGWGWGWGWGWFLGWFLDWRWVTLPALF